MSTIVKVISGQHRGVIGQINGDLSERAKTLGRDGKVQMFTELKRPLNIILIRVRHLEEYRELFS